MNGINALIERHKRACFLSLSAFLLHVDTARRQQSAMERKKALNRAFLTEPNYTGTLILDV